MQCQKTRCRKILLFTRFPEPGKAKTRLIPALGAEGAAALQRRMTEATLKNLLSFSAASGAHSEIRFDGGDTAGVRRWLPGAVGYAPQGEGNLGDRLQRAFAAAFHSGATRVIVVGADCPALSPQHLDEAFNALSDHDLVLGPAADGGYYLIGLRRPAPQLFHHIAWGTGTVLAATLRLARAMQLTIHQLEQLADVDRPEDLAHLDHHSDAQ